MQVRNVVRVCSHSLHLPVTLAAGQFPQWDKSIHFIAVVLAYVKSVFYNAAYWETRTRHPPFNPEAAQLSVLALGGCRGLCAPCVSRVAGGARRTAKCLIRCGRGLRVGVVELQCRSCALYSVANNAHSSPFGIDSRTLRFVCTTPLVLRTGLFGVDALGSHLW